MMQMKHLFFNPPHNKQQKPHIPPIMPASQPANDRQAAAVTPKERSSSSQAVISESDPHTVSSKKV
jgi:hypothetical protein